MPQCVAGGAQFLVALHGGLVRGQQQVEDLQPVRGDEMFLAVEHDLQAHARLLAAAHFAVDQHELDAAQQLIGLIRLQNEIVRAALQPTNHILRDPTAS